MERAVGIAPECRPRRYRTATMQTWENFRIPVIDPQTPLRCRRGAPGARGRGGPRRFCFEMFWVCSFPLIRYV